MRKRLLALLAAVLMVAAAACDSSQPNGWRLTRTSGSQTLVYLVQPHANTALDWSFQYAANTWSWNPRLEVRYVRSCPARASCIHVMLENTSPNLGYAQILSGTGLAAYHYHTAKIAVMWPFPSNQNLLFVACHEVGHAIGLRHGDHYVGNGFDGPCDYNANYPTDHDQRTVEQIYSHANDAVGASGV